MEYKFNRIQNWKAKTLHSIFRNIFELNNRLNMFKLNGWEGVYWEGFSRHFFKTKELCLRNNFGQKLRVRTNQLVDFTAVFGRKEEVKIVDLLQKLLKENSNYIDCGAHIGRYSLIASRFCKKGCIISIEPFPDNYALLQENINLNNILNIKALNVAAGKEEGQCSLYIGKDYATNTLCLNWLEQMDKQSTNCNKIKVNQRTIDNIIKESKLLSIDLLKIDVEGAELEVIIGCNKALSQGIIKNIICEIHEPIADKREILSVLQSFNYIISDIGGSEILAVLR